MNVAILIFGQPRFFESTWPLILEEFNFGPYDINVEFFAHFWDQVGYIPIGTEEEYKKDIVEICKNEPAFRKFVIEKYDGTRIFLQKNCIKSETNETSLDKTCENLYTYYNNIQLPIEEHITTLRYRFGQHYSVREAYKLITQYEKDYSKEINKDFKYDIIIKIRTDILYRPKESFKNIGLYYKYKYEHYIDNIKSNTIKCNALRFLDLTDKMDDPNGEPKTTNLNYYKNNEYITLEANPYDLKDGDIKKHIEEYPIRLCLNDWSLTAGRDAAEIYYNTWFQNFHYTVTKDLKQTKTRKKLICGSEHSLQGQFLLNNPNIEAKLNKMRRDVRLLHKDQIKPDVSPTGKLLIDENTTTEELREMVKYYYRRKKPGETR